MSKKSYINLLKESLSEFDTSDTVEVKGPMLDPILSWNGDGELPTQKDAASILERYYFNENHDRGVETLEEADFENDKGKADAKAQKHAKGAGTEQAGTDDAKTIPAAKKNKEEDIVKEAKEEEKEDESKEEEKEEAGDEKEDESKEDEKEEVEESTDLSEDLEMENAIIEKLIAEMEDDEVDLNEEKKATDPEQHTTGAGGTEQAGTGDAEGEIPPRKDLHDKFVKPKNYNENEEIEEALAQLESEILEADDMEDAEADAEAEKDLDVDKEMNESSAVPGGPSPKKRGEDWESDEAYFAEAFELFKESMEDDEDKE